MVAGGGIEPPTQAFSVQFRAFQALFHDVSKRLNFPYLPRDSAFANQKDSVKQGVEKIEIKHKNQAQRGIDENQAAAAGLLPVFLVESCHSRSAP